jgi:SAM-dependent methyltransferase
MPLNLQKLKIERKDLDEKENSALDLYMNEAYFFFNMIKPEIECPKMTFYEIGSGIGLVSRLISDYGHKVIATDPQSAGFGVMYKLNKIIERSFEHKSFLPEFYTLKAEDLAKVLKNKNINIDMAFCANVIEHVGNLEPFFESILNNLKPNGKFRFICPNSAFPYEPHFGFITLFSKKLTYLVKRHYIINAGIEKPLEFYQELSFPTIFKINRSINRDKYQIIFHKSATKFYLERIFSDDFYQKRKKIIYQLVKLLKPLIRVIVVISPKILIPIIDGQISHKQI